MVAVIADDLTGAAEIAGISLRFGLELKVYLDVTEMLHNPPSGDGMIIATDSRSMQKAAAIYCTADAVEAVLQFEPALLYKKIDSVLRGYVTDEIKLQMELSGKQKAFILPANPSLNRTISNGEYFIEGKKITETGFVNDPEFPVSSAVIKDMLHDETVQLARHDDWLPVEGIVVGEAETTADVQCWAAAIDDSWMLVGAGDLYTALLEKDHGQVEQPGYHLQLPHLYVCGTAFEDRKAFVKQLDCCAYLPGDVTAEWLQQTASIIKEQKKLVIAIEESNETALVLRTTMARAVKEMVTRENIKEIFIEGGSTAAAVLEELGIKMLIPVNELSRGVVRMRTGDLFITFKPGSYQLPEEILKLYS